MKVFKGFLLGLVSAGMLGQFGGAAAVECFTDMKFGEACDSGFTAMLEAANKAKVTFR